MAESSESVLPSQSSQEKKVPKNKDPYGSNWSPDYAESARERRDSLDPEDPLRQDIENGLKNFEKRQKEISEMSDRFRDGDAEEREMVTDWMEKHGIPRDEVKAVVEYKLDQAIKSGTQRDQGRVERGTSVGAETQTPVIRLDATLPPKVHIPPVRQDRDDRRGLLEPATVVEVLPPLTSRLGKTSAPSNDSGSSKGGNPPSKGK